MSLVSRLNKLECRQTTLARPVHVVIQKVDESDEKVLNKIKLINCKPAELLIVVKFFEPKSILN
jgi:hypothetical protein